MKLTRRIRPAGYQNENGPRVLHAGHFYFALRPLETAPGKRASVVTPVNGIQDCTLPQVCGTDAGAAPSTAA